MSTLFEKPAVVLPFFTAGGTLRRDAECYVTRAADHQLLEALQQGEFCYVLTARQMGKSSLMVRTAARLRQTGVAVAVVDLTAFGTNLTPEQWYDQLLARIGRELGIEDSLDAFWQEKSRMAPLGRFVSALEQVVLPRVPGRVVIFVDEIDVVRSLPFPADEFFAAVRELYNRRAEEPNLAQLCFCLLGVASPSDLIRDERMTPFNIGRRVVLTDFTLDEARPLAVGLTTRRRQDENRQEAAAQSSSVQSETLKRIHYWTGGHPYLTQRLCYALTEMDGHGPFRPRDVDRLCNSLFFAHGASDTEDNLRFVSDRLQRAGGDANALFTLYLRVRQGHAIPDDSADPLLEALRLSGVVKSSGGLLTTRNRIYRRVFNEAWVVRHLEPAEVLRQREAYRQGLYRAIAVSTVIITVLSVVTLFAIVKNREANDLKDKAQTSEAQTSTALDRAIHVENVSRRNLYFAGMNLAAPLLQSGEMARLNEVLERTKPWDTIEIKVGRVEHEDLRGFEWRYYWRLCRGESVINEAGFRNAISIAVTSDGRTVAWCSRANEVAIVSLGTSRKPVIYVPGATVTALHFSQDGASVRASSEDGKVTTFDWHDGPVKFVAEGRSPQRSPAGTPPKNAVLVARSGSVTAVGDGDGYIAVRGVPGRPEQRWMAHTKAIRSIALSWDGRALASIDGDNIARTWRLPQPAPFETIRVGSGVQSADFSGHHNDLFAGSVDGRARLYSAPGETGSEWKARLLATNSGTAPQVAICGKDKPNELAAVGRADGVIIIRDLDRGTPAIELRGPRAPVTHLTATRKGHLLGASYADSSVYVWDLDRYRDPPIRIGVDAGPSRAVTGIDIEPSGERLAVICATGPMQIYNLKNGQRDFKWRAPFQRPPTSVAWGYYGNTFLATGHVDGSVEIWDVPSKQRKFHLIGHRGAVRAIAFSPDKRTLATGGDDGTARMWDFLYGESLGMLPTSGGAIRAIAFSPDTRRLAAARASGEISVWTAISARDPKVFGERSLKK